MTKPKKQLDFDNLLLDVQRDKELMSKQLQSAGTQHHNHGAQPPPVQYTAVPGKAGHAQALLLHTAKLQGIVEPNQCTSNMEYHHDVTDMTGKMTPEGRRMLVRACVKTVLFRRLKFFKKELHGMYDQSASSVCGLMIQHCNVPLQDATLAWWATMRKVVIATHTDHRNNVIKTMRLRFRGKYPLRPRVKCNAQMSIAYN
jgi:hypothetical protein